MKRIKHLHTEFIKFLIESEGQSQNEKDKREKEVEETEIDEVLPDEENEDKEDEESEEIDADKVIEKLIQRQKKYKKEYENILQGRK